MKIDIENVKHFPTLPGTAYEVMREIFPRASPRELLLTASETVANLEVLEARGEALRDLEGGVYRFRLAA